MAIQQGPPPQKQPPQKSGMGCFGCGCLIVILFLLLLGGIVGGFVYYCYHLAYLVSSAQPAAVAPFNGPESVYDGAQKKIADFNQDVTASKTSTLTLSADEINALIAHSPDIKKYQVQAHVTMQGDRMRLEGEVPSNAIPLINWGVKDRYYNFDVTTGISFNTDTKEIEFDFHKLQIGDVPYPEDSLSSMQASFSRPFNQQLRQNAAVWNVLQVAKTVTVKDGQFVIETK